MKKDRKAFSPNFSLSVVIPCYNEESRVSKLTQALRSFGDKWNGDYEIIIVNDGSTDRTLEIIEGDSFINQLKEESKLKILSLGKNSGKGVALKRGVAETTKDFILTMDADVAAHPLELGKWFKKLKTFKQNQILIGSREHAKSKIEEKWYRKLFGRVFNLCVQVISGLSIKDTQCGFKLYPGSVGRELFSNLRVTGWAHDIELLLRAQQRGIKIKELPLNWTYQEGSKINVMLDSIRMFLQLILITIIVKFDWFFRQPVRQILSRDSSTENSVPGHDKGIYRLAFAALFAMILIGMPLMSFHYGVNGDEHIHYKYGNEILEYYGHWDIDKMEVYKFYNLEYYGGLFDFVGAATISLIDSIGEFDSLFSEYQIRHFWNAIFGAFAMLFCGLIARNIGGWRMGLVALLFILLTPRFFGHSMNNGKDIPFAMTYAFAIYYIIKLFSESPKISFRTAFLLTIALAMAINIRVGGVLLIIYAAFFIGLKMLYLLNQKKTSWQTVRRVAFAGVTIAVLGYLGGILFWPYALADPINHPLEALREFSKFPHRIMVLFEGEHYLSTEMPWYYMPKTIFVTIPEIVAVSFATSVLVFYWMRDAFDLRKVLIAGFVTIFPVAYAIIQESTFYSEWRQFLFIYPTMVVCAALIWEYMFRQHSKILNYGAAFVLVAGLVPGVLFMIKNHGNDYVHHNAFVGGMEGAFGNYDLDYYQHGMKYAAEWMRSNLDLEGKVLVTNCQDAARIYFDGSSNNDPVISAMNYHSRVFSNWDYAVFSSRFVDKHQLKNGYWPPANTIHTIEANGVPLIAVLERKNKFDSDGYLQLNRGNNPRAIELFERSLKDDPNNEGAYNGLGRAYLNLGEMDKSKTNIDRSLKLYPRNPETMKTLGLYHLNNADPRSAAQVFDEIIRENRREWDVYYYSALAHLYLKNFEKVERILERVLLKRMPRNKNVFLLAVQLYEQMGNEQKARQYQEIVDKM